MLPMTLGRVPQSDLVLKDSEVSGKHAQINWNANVSCSHHFLFFHIYHPTVSKPYIILNDRVFLSAGTFSAFTFIFVACLWSLQPLFLLSVMMLQFLD